MSRPSISSSASTGWPAIPRRLDHGTLVHVPAGCELDVLAVLGEHHAEPRGVLERPAHEAAVLHPAAVVCEKTHPEGRQLGHRSELLAAASHRDGPGHGDLGQGVRAEGEHVAGDCAGVDGRLGVRHGDEGRVPAQGCGPRA